MKKETMTTLRILIVKSLLDQFPKVRRFVKDYLKAYYEVSLSTSK